MQCHSYLIRRNLISIKPENEVQKLSKSQQSAGDDFIDCDI